MKRDFRTLLAAISGAALSLMLSANIVAHRTDVLEYHEELLQADMVAMAHNEPAAPAMSHKNKKHKKHKARKAQHDMHHAPTREEQIEHWREYKAQKMARLEELGRFSHLFHQPAWPQYLQQGLHESMIGVNVSYERANRSYNGTGSTVGIFDQYVGKGGVQLQDLLLASKLAAAGVVTQTTDGIFGVPGLNGAAAVVPATTNLYATGTANNDYLKKLAANVVEFHARNERYASDLSFMRYFWNNRVGLGVNVPLVYMEHSLRAKIDLSNKNLGMAVSNLLPATVVAPGSGMLPLATIGGALNPALTFADYIPNAFLNRYGQDDQAFIKDIFNSKGMRELGGSTSGIGDLSLFAQVRMDMPKLDNALAGINLILPTAQKQTTSKLWSPELGNGGFFQGKLFAGLSAKHSRCCNPHLMVDVSAYLPAHVSRRVPQKQSLPAVAGAGQAATGMTFGDRVTFAGATAGQSNQFDTTLRGVSDKVANFKITPGLESNLRVGNIFDRVLARSAFLDIFYNCRAKLRDDAMGLSQDVWDVDQYIKDSAQIAHTIGGEWSYQFNDNLRVRGGVSYVFAGMNVDKTLQLTCGLQQSF